MLGSGVVSSFPPIDERRGAWLALYADTLREWLAMGRPVHLPLSGASMRPTIDDHAHLVLERADATEIGIGDVFVYEDGAHLVCHRVLARSRDRRRLLTAAGAPPPP